jgi:predicted Rossmann-fold nucleotide-binding protein
VGTAWKKLIEWVKRYPLKQNLVSPGDFNNIHVVRNEKEAFEAIEEAHAQFKSLGKDACLNLTKYKVIPNA